MQEGENTLKYYIFVGFSSFVYYACREETEYFGSDFLNFLLSDVVICGLGSWGGYLHSTLSFHLHHLESSVINSVDDVCITIIISSYFSTNKQNNNNNNNKKGGGGSSD